MERPRREARRVTHVTIVTVRHVVTAIQSGRAGVTSVT